jgi:single-strand DNA-binding protein
LVVASLSVVTSETWKDKQGVKQEKSEWHRISAFGKLAEIISQYVTKGMLISIQGKLQTDEYEKDGIKRYTTKIIAEKMQMLGSKGDSKPKQDRATKIQQNEFDPVGDMDDVPF